MPPYYMSDCVEYYSPALDFKQYFVAFVVGFLIGSLLSELNRQFGKPEEAQRIERPQEQADALAIQLARQVDELENQLSRSFHAIALLGFFLWLSFVVMIVQIKSPLNIKTEL